MAHLINGPVNKFFSSLKKVFIGEDLNVGEIETELNTIKRIAIDQSGNIGSLYDESLDSIIGKVRVKPKSQTCDLDKPIICQLYKGRTPETQNLLKMVDIDKSLRMNILLKMIQPTGIASIIDYPKSIDKYTRFLYFRYESRIKLCHGDLLQKIKGSTIPELATSTTCVLTQIIRGIHAVVVLQLPPDQQDEINDLLEKICKTLTNSKHDIDISSEGKDLLDRIIFTTVYSNISALTKMKNLFEVCQRIQIMKHNFDKHVQLEYILTQTQRPNSDHDGNNVTITRFDQYVTEDLENELLQQLSELRILQMRLYYELPELLQDKLEERLTAVQQSFSEIKQLHNNDMQQISDLLKRLRKGDDVLNDIEAALKSDVQATIKDYIQRLVISLDNLTAKGKLIKQLQNDGFEYCDVIKLEINQDCNEQEVKDILFKNNLKKFIFCSTDQLKNQSPDQWAQLYSETIAERQKNSQFTFVYADFTYSTWPLEKIVVLSSKDQNIPKSQSISKTTLRHTEKKTHLPLLKSTDNYINILLLGESGVGKSTFINAFANYLQFNSLKQAQSGQPIVVIPVSFLMTINDNFDEQVIKFGESDPNENHNNIGQSVTQQCRSYVFEISPEKKLRIIDTPGFADTRGDSQDEINMNMIISFMNNLTHLNGICLLLKPNVGQLNPFLYTCFTQIFQCFGENIRNHLIFCFTNARSTFFAPGDTRPLLKLFFDSFPVKNIPFEKKNTFCFDSESFRYLVARQRSLTFSEVEESDFEKSWIQSVEESQRLRTFLCEKLRPYRKNVEWQSVENAHFQINSLIRPLLEAIRNILRNIILHRTNSSIILRASCVKQPLMIYYTLDRTLAKFGDFWIFSDYLRSSSNTDTSIEQSPTEYRLSYKFVPDHTNESIETLKQQEKFLCETCATFACFLTRTQAKQDDPFLSGFIRMIKEEEFICQKRKQNIFNQQLVTDLKLLKNEYEQLVQKTYPSSMDEPLSNIYNSMLSVDDIPMVKKQVNAIKAYQQHFLTTNEQDLIKQSTWF